MLSHPSTFPVHRATLAAKPKEFARPGYAVTNGAFTPSSWEIGSHIHAVRNTNYWNDKANRIDVVRYVHVADPVDRAHALSRGRPRRDLHRAAGRGRPAREGATWAAADRAACRGLLLRVRARPAAIQGFTETAPGARHGRGPRCPDAAGPGRRRAACLWLGPAGRCRLHPATIRLGRPRREGAHRGSEAALCGSRLFRQRTAQGGAALPARAPCTIASRSPSLRCGRSISARR